jgi:hypothetical protein
MVYSVSRLSSVSSRWTGSHSQTSDVTSTHMTMSRSLIIDNEGEGEGGPPPCAPTPPVPAGTTSASAPGVVEAEAEAVVVEQPKPRHGKVRYDQDTRPRKTEILAKGTFTSRSIDFVFQNNSAFFLTLTFFNSGLMLALSLHI